MNIENFKEFLNKHRKVKLYHKELWYKSKTINKVVKYTKNKDECQHCGYGNRIIYAVSTKSGPCFYIDCWDGCLSYSEQIEILDFDNEIYLNNYIADTSVNKSSSESSDSY